MAEPSDIVKLVLQMRQAGGVPDETLLRKCLGEAEVSSLNKIAEIFGVAPHTVRHTWRPNGMPAIETKRGKGCRVVLVEVLLWLVKRDATNAKARGEDEFTKRRREAETLSAEEDARLRRIKREREEGKFVSVAVVRAEWASFLSVFRDDVVSIADDIKPMFPAKEADQLTAELDRRLGKALDALAERPMEEFLERMNDDGEETN